MPVDGVDPRESGRKLVDGVGGLAAAILIVPLMIGFAVFLIFVMLIPLGIAVDVVREIWSLF